MDYLTRELGNEIIKIINKAIRRVALIGLENTLFETKQQILKSAYNISGENKRLAAELLKVNRTTFVEMFKRYKVGEPDVIFDSYSCPRCGKKVISPSSTELPKHQCRGTKYRCRRRRCSFPFSIKKINILKR